MQPATVNIAMHLTCRRLVKVSTLIMNGARRVQDDAPSITRFLRSFVPRLIINRRASINIVESNGIFLPFDCAHALETHLIM